MSLSAQMHLSDQSAGCPTSPHQSLWLTDDGDVCIIAHGAPAGCVVLRVLQGHDQPAPSETSALKGKAMVVSLALAGAQQVAAPVTATAWCSQDQERKLAAAAGCKIAVFCLEHCVAALADNASSNVHADQIPTYQAEHSHSIAAVSWTQEGDGLLTADSQGCVVMWRLMTSTEHNSQQLVQAWIGGSSTVVQPQSILTAGANILSPSASACPGTRIVTLWWPQELQDNAAPQAQAPSAKAAEPAAMIAIAEQLRHPVGVVDASWSPGSLQHGAASSEASSEVDASPMAATSQPALMTVGYDGMIRIWVEVTLSPSLGTNPPASPSRSAGPATPTSPGTPANVVRGHQLLGTSQFCLTLVVQPPNSTLIGFQPDSLRACWGVPCQPQLGPATRMAAGSVLWILAMVDGSQQAKQPGDKIEDGSASDQLLLWAVEGLAGVVIDGIPNNVPGTRALNTPRAVLWGQQHESLSWPGGHTAPISRRHLACSVALHDEAPVLQVVESCPVGQHGDMLLRSYAVHSVDDEATAEGSQRSSSAMSSVPPRQLPLHDLAVQSLQGHQQAIVHLSAHPSSPLAFTVDKSGLARLWHTAPLTPLGLLTDLLPLSEAQLVEGIQGACWLEEEQEAGGSSTAFLAVAGQRQLALLEVTLQTASKGTDSTLTQVHVLTHTGPPSDSLKITSLTALRRPTPTSSSSGLPRAGVVHILGTLSYNQLQSNESVGIIEAVAVWEIAAAASPSGSAQQARQSRPQGISNQPSGSKQLQLVCLQNMVPQADVVHVLASTEASAQLVLGSAHGDLHHMSLDWSRGNFSPRGGTSPQNNLTSKSAGMLSCKGIPSSSRVCSIATTGSCSHMAALTQDQHNAVHLMIWQSETAASAWQYTLQASVALPCSPTAAAKPTAVAWLPGLGTSLAVAVACSSHLLIFCPAHGGIWAQIAKLGNLAQPLSALQISHTGLPVISAGTQIALVSNMVSNLAQLDADHCSQQGLAQVPLGHLVLEAGGPLPDYAPAALALLIARGRMSAGVQVIRCVLAWLKLHAAQQDPSTATPSHSSHTQLAHQLLPDAPLNVLLDKAFLSAFPSIIPALPLSASTVAEQRQNRQSAAEQYTGQSGLSHPGSPSPAPADQYADGAGDFGTDDSSQASDAQMHQTAADPYAFDAGAFGGSSSPQKQPQAPSAAKDPFAFDMGAFGMLQEEGQQEEAESQQEPTQNEAAQSNDPFAFDARAFALDDQKQQATQAAQTDPYAFDAGVFGMADSNDTVAGETDASGQHQPSAPSQAKNTDPFAFDPGAFGFSGKEQPQTDPQEPQQASLQASSNAADPFAFDGGAFGFGAQPDPAREEEADQASPEIVPADNGTGPAAAQAADPFAFDAGAFALDFQQQEEEATSTKQASQSRPSGAKATAAGDVSTDADNMPMSKHKPGAIAIQPGPNPQQAGQQKTRQSGGSVTAQRTAAQSAVTPQPQIYRPKFSKAQESHTPLLSDAEFSELYQLLESALASSSVSPSSLDHSPAVSPMTDHMTDHSDGNPHPMAGGAAALPPGLTPRESIALLNIAHLLCKDPRGADLDYLSRQGPGSSSGRSLLLDRLQVDWTALDAAAQKMVRSVQLATCASHIPAGRSDESETDVGQQQSQEVLDGLMAKPRAAASPGDRAFKAHEDPGDPSWAEGVGLQRGLPTSALMWALLSDSQDAQLTHTLNQLPAVEDEEDQVAAPEFGFSTSSAAAPGAHKAPLLSWQAMRHVGAGFWLTDPLVVKVWAEALAKAQYARRKDPHDCALMYVALQRKQLLLGLFRSSNHKKLADFLSRDFSQDKNKDAACKNAFVLLGQHRPELAAAFFVLGGAHRDAVGVCAHEVKDPQLALFLARLLEGPQGPLQQALISAELLPDAEERGDAWAMCLLSWLQGRPGTALQMLMPQPEQASGSSTDRSINPGHLGTSTASTSGRVQSSSSSSPHLGKAPSTWQGSVLKSRAGCSEAMQGSLALDLVSWCLSGAAVSAWPGQLPSLQQLRQLALQAAHCLEEEGHHVMALESHQLASMCQHQSSSSSNDAGQDPHRSRYLPSSQSSSGSQALAQPDSNEQQQQQILAAWRQRLVTASLLRCLVDTTHPSQAAPLLAPLAIPPAPVHPTDAQHLLSQRWTLHRNKGQGLTPAPRPSQSQWRKLAQQQLQMLQDAGFETDGELAMEHLHAVYDSLLPDSEDVHQGEDAGQGATGGLMHSISGMSALSTPRKNSTLSSGAMSGAQGAVFDESHRLLHVDSDRLHAVCASNAGVYGYAGADRRPFAAASVKHGIVVGEVSLHALPSHRHSEDGRSPAAIDKGLTFSAILGDMLEAVRWPGEPTSAPSSPFRGSRPPKPESPSAKRVRVPVGQIGTSTLAAHPTRQLFLTGCATGEIYLCQFGETKAKAGYTPMPGHLDDPAPAPQSLFTTPPKSWNPSPGVNFTHWGQPQAVCWSDDGERFGGLGDGGVVATWRLDAPRMQASDTGYLGRSDWCHQGLSKRGMDLTYLGSGNCVLAVAGQCSQGGNIVIWDTQQPLRAGPVARLSHHAAAVTTLKVLPGSQLLASADEQGNIAVKDLRMLGGSSQHAPWPRTSPSKAPPAPTRTANTAAAHASAGSSWYHSGNAAARGLVWEVRGAHQGQGVVRMIAGLRPLSDGATGGPMLVTGGRDGSINVWSCHRGRHLQAIERAHAASPASTKGRNFFADAFRSKPFGVPPPVITGLSLTADGLLSCGLDGNVKLHPFL